MYPIEQIDIIYSAIDSVLNNTIEYFNNYIFYFEKKSQKNTARDFIKKLAKGIFIDGLTLAACKFYRLAKLKKLIYNKINLSKLTILILNFCSLIFYYCSFHILESFLTSVPL